MSYLRSGEGAIDYAWCHYGRSRLLFRGPRRRLSGRYCVVLGGSETFGKYVLQPFPALLESALELPVLNLGLANAGPDVFLADGAVTDLAAGAAVTVVQVPGATNMSNRFYTVHPRRNDRFLGASDALRALYPRVDFTEFNFTRHMLSTLERRDAEAFMQVATCLKATWVDRMKALLARIPGRKLLVRLGDHHPAGTGSCRLGLNPLLVDEQMLASLAGHADMLLRIDPAADVPGPGVAGLAIPEGEASVAAETPGPRFHADVAAVLAPVLQDLLAA